MRKSRFFQKDAYISVDMLKKETEIMRMRTVETPDPFAVTLDLGPGKDIGRSRSKSRKYPPPMRSVRNCVPSRKQSWETVNRRCPPGTAWPLWN